MTVQIQTPYNTYIANGSTTIFPYSFRTLTENDIAVYVNNQIKTTGFTINGINEVNGGDVTFDIPPSSGAVVHIARNISYTRDTDYLDSGTLDANVLDSDFDRVVMMIQDLNSRTLSYDSANRIDARNQTIVNVAEPINSTDASTKDYVDRKITTSGNVPVPNNPNDNDKYLKVVNGIATWDTIPLLNDSSVRLVTNSTDVSELWRKTNNGEPIYSTPIFVPDFSCTSYTGPVFIYQSWDWYLYVVKATDGATVWRYPFGGPNYGRPEYIKVGLTQRIFGASHEGYLYCLDENGNKIWHVASLYYREATGTLTKSGSSYTDSTKNWAVNSFIRSTTNSTYNARITLTPTGGGSSYGPFPITACSGTSVSIDIGGASVPNGDYDYSISPMYESDVYFQHAGTAVEESGTIYLYAAGFDNQCVKINISTAAIVWRYSSLENCEAYPVVTDIDNDGNQECIFSSVDGRIYILNASNGNLKGSIQGDEGFDSFIRYAPIHGTNTKYIVSGNRDGRVYTINGSTRTIENKSSSFSALAGNDIDSGCALIPNIDGTYNIFVATDPGYLVMLDRNMDVLWRANTNNLHNSTPQYTTIGDVECIVVCDMAGAVSFYSLTGRLLSVFYVRGGIEGTPYIGDIDNDGKKEILITTLDGLVYLFRINKI